jgi:hypothetical protein
MKKAKKAKKAKKIKKTAKKRIVVQKPKGPVYACRSCGTEVIVTNTGMGFANLLCCQQEMEKKA